MLAKAVQYMQTMVKYQNAIPTFMCRKNVHQISLDSCFSAFSLATFYCRLHDHASDRQKWTQTSNTSLIATSFVLNPPLNDFDLTFANFYLFFAAY